MYLEKIASADTSRLEKIAAAIAAAQAGEDLDKIAAAIAEQGITEREVELASNLFAEPESEDALLQKAAEAFVSEETTPLEKVAAAIDLTVAGAISPEDTYAAAEELGFSQQDVDYIYKVAYGETGDEEIGKEAGAKTEAVESVLAKLKNQLADIATAKEAKEGLREAKVMQGRIKEVAPDKGSETAQKMQEALNKARIKAAKGAAKTGLLYGVPAAVAGYGGYAALGGSGEGQ